MEPDIQSLGLGKDIQIIRQRFFIDHTSNKDKSFLEEYTLMCQTSKGNKISNIFLKIPKILPNLKVYDSDGTDLPIITNKYTKALVKYMIKTEKNNQIKEDLLTLQQDLRDKKFWIIWIKLPHDRPMLNSDARVISLEYGATKEEMDKDTHIIEYHTQKHEVFYVVTPPEDYEINREKAEVIESESLFVKDNLSDVDKDTTPFFRNKNADSITYMVRPNVEEPIRFMYSFKAKKNIISIPKISWGMLIAISSIMIAFKSFQINSIYCVEKLCIDTNSIMQKDVEIGIGLVAASLIIASLIQNQEIRNKYRIPFFISIVLSVISVILHV